MPSPPDVRMRSAISRVGALRGARTSARSQLFGAGRNAGRARVAESPRSVAGPPPQSLPAPKA
eukprot:6236885-Alexandrium_andersonii.AAC.1